MIRPDSQWFFDKENGTTHAIDPLPLSDSANNEYHSGDPDCGECGDEGSIMGFDRQLGEMIGRPCPRCQGDEE